jgi:hypothetical protein
VSFLKLKLFYKIHSATTTNEINNKNSNKNQTRNIILIFFAPIMLYINSRYFLKYFNK